MIATLALFGLLGVTLIGVGERLGRRAFLVGALAPAVSVVWTVAHLAGIVDGDVVSEHVTWVRDLDLGLDLRIDGFGATMTLVVAAIGVLVFVYAAAYFGPETRDIGRIAGLLVLFAGSMVGLVQADHVLVLYTCWELTSITSYLLIGNKYTDEDARAAALQALLVTGAGGLAMLGGFVLLAREAGTFHLSELAAGPVPQGAAVEVALVLILLGAFTKSAQYPFHSWLPAAMAAPTPVSAYLHSAAMVKAGVYLVARLAPIFAVVGLWRPTVITVGLVTFVFGGLRAIRQHDLKLLLAFGTVSQLGLMIVLFGAGVPEATAAGWELLVAHAIFKGALFMVVGVLDRRTGTRDIRALPALGREWRWVEVTALVSAASMAGLPFVIGFVAKEAAYEALADTSFANHWLVLGAVVAGSMLTVAYATRFYWYAFVEPRRQARDPSDPKRHSPGAFAAPGALLASVSLLFGLVPGLLDRLVTASVDGLTGSLDPVHLCVWHGFNLPLTLSAVAVAGGLLVAVADRRAQRVLATGSVVPQGEAVYLVILRAVSSTARTVTGVVQNGSLPVYSGVILATAALLPIGAVSLDWDWPGWPKFWSAGDVPAAAMLIVAALGAATVRRRFSAAIFLGAAGYAMAGLFVLYGAPDLALTQATVETLSTVVFVLVLRRLPERFERQSSARRRAVRLLIAGSVGAAVFVFAILASAGHPTPSVSNEMIARAVPDGHGANVVNVILVDFRALDTLGEITVLGVAAIGAVALARVGRRVKEEQGQALVPRRASPPRRVVFVDVSVQVIFHAVVMASLWLLFSGHNQPGGGFVGGLLAGSAITLRYIAGGIDEVREISRFRPWTVLGTGLLLAAGTAAFPLLGGGAVLDVASGSWTLPPFGTAHLSSALLFDIGVYLTVVGVVLMAYESFGDESADEPAGVAP